MLEVKKFIFDFDGDRDQQPNNQTNKIIIEVKNS